MFYSMKKPSIFILLIVTLTIAFLFFFFTGRPFSMRPIEEDAERAVYPPLILINDTYYKASGFSTENLPLESTYLGEILSSVPGYEKPTQSFQANNIDIVGAAIYQSKAQLFVQNNNIWCEYLEIIEKQ